MLIALELQQARAKPNDPPMRSATTPAPRPVPETPLIRAMLSVSAPQFHATPFSFVHSIALRAFTAPPAAR